MFQKHDSPFNTAFRRKHYPFPLKRTQTVDMTEDSILGHIIRFAVPMLLGSIFSLLYSTIDSWVIGNFGSSESYAAIGAVGPIINILTWGSAGIGSGVSVLLGQKVGARKTQDVDQIVHTACASFFLFGILLTVFGNLTATLSLDLLNTPKSIQGEGLIYMRIYYLLTPGSLLTQACHNTLRSVGKPGITVLIGALGAVLNTVLDLIFVICFGMGIAGVAWATLIVVYLEAMLSLLVLARMRDLCTFRFSKLRISWTHLRPILVLGLPIAIQQSINSVSGALVQSYVNHFGSDCIAAWYTYRKMQGLMETPVGPVISAISVFTAQNMGALKLDRIKKSIGISVLICLVLCGSAGMLTLFFAPQFAAFFNSKPEVVAISANLLRFFIPLLFFNNCTNLYISYFRGMGNTRTPMIISISTFTVFRQICMIAALKIFDNFYVVTAAFPFTWLVATVIILPYFYHYFKRKQQELSNKEHFPS